MRYTIEMTKEDEKAYEHSRKMYNHHKDIAEKVRWNLNLHTEVFNTKYKEIFARAENELPKDLLERIPHLVKSFNMSREFFRHAYPITGVSYSEGIPKSRLTAAFTEYLLENEDMRDSFT